MQQMYTCVWKQQPWLLLISRIKQLRSPPNTNFVLSHNTHLEGPLGGRQTNTSASWQLNSNPESVASSTKPNRWQKKYDVMVDVLRKHISATIYGSTFGDTVFFKRCFGDRGGRCKMRLQNDVSQRGRLPKSPTSNIHTYINKGVYTIHTKHTIA